MDRLPFCTVTEDQNVRTFGIRRIVLDHDGAVETGLRIPYADVVCCQFFVAVERHANLAARSDALDVEFVCIPRPAERSGREDGGPLAYRVRFRAPLWQAGGKPALAMRVV